MRSVYFVVIFFLNLRIIEIIAAEYKQMAKLIGVIMEKGIEQSQGLACDFELPF